MKTNRRSNLKLLLALCAFGPLAASAEIYTDEYGRKMECHDEQVTTTTEKDGHPVAGTILGGAAGHEIAKGGTRSETHTERRCTPVSG